MIMQIEKSEIGKRVFGTITAVVFCCVLPAAARAQDADLAKKLSNPLAAMISKLVNIGGQRVSLQGGVRYYAASTTGGADG